MPNFPTSGPYGRVPYGSPAPFGFGAAPQPGWNQSLPGGSSAAYGSAAAGQAFRTGGFGPPLAAPLLNVSDDAPSGAYSRPGFSPVPPDFFAEWKKNSLPGNAAVGRFLEDRFKNGGTYLGGLAAAGLTRLLFDRFGGGGWGGGGGRGGDGRRGSDYGPECRDEWDHALRLCQDAMNDPNRQDVFGKNSRDKWDCARGIVGPECGGDPVKPPPPRKIRRYDLGPKDPED